MLSKTSETVTTNRKSINKNNTRVCKKQKRELTYLDVHRVQLIKLLKRFEGRFIGVTYVKQDGTTRKLNGRLGVHSYLKGGINTVQADSRPYITIFDVKALEYRTVNLASLQSLRGDRLVYTVLG
jgi:hypothetical protein